MMLRSLVELAASLDDLPPEGYRRRDNVRWAIELAADGSLRHPSLVDLRGDDPGRSARGQSMLVPDVQRSGTAPLPILAVDTLEYLLGLSAAPGEAKADEAATRKHSAAVELAVRAATEHPHPVIRALATFLRTPTVVVPDDAASKDLAAVRVDGTWVHDLPEAQAAWAAEVRRRKTSGRTGRCLACGEPGLLVDTFPEQIPLGLVPGQTQQLAVVSTNTDAQARWGKIGLDAVPVCRGCAGRSVAALTWVLRSERHRRWLGDSVLAWWVTGRAEFDALSLLDNPTPDDVAALVSSASRGRRRPSPLETERFRALLLGVSASRLVLRRAVDVSLAEASASLARWFSDHEIADPWEPAPVWIPLWRLALATGRFRKDAKRFDDPAHGARAALELAALTGEPPPVALLGHLLARVRADRHLGVERAALLRLLLIRHRLAQEETTMPALTDTDDVAYLCGRVLAVLDRLQATALPEAKARVADRILGRAATAPGTVLPRALIDGQAHLKKLRTIGNPGAAVAISQRLDELVARLPDIPRVLSTPEQARFLLGFHHQRADDVRQARARGAAKRATETEPETEVVE